MNTVKSFWIGWASLCVAGGGAYVYAKRSINADRAERFEKEQKKRRMQEALEYSSKQTVSSTSSLPKTNGGPPRSDLSGSPSQEATVDPAPTRHAPESEGQRVREKSKYETSTPFVAKKGDRFS